MFHHNKTGNTEFDKLPEGIFHLVCIDVQLLVYMHLRPNKMVILQPHQMVMQMILEWRFSFRKVEWKSKFFNPKKGTFLIIIEEQLFINTQSRKRIIFESHKFQQLSYYASYWWLNQELLTSASPSFWWKCQNTL